MQFIQYYIMCFFQNERTPLPRNTIIASGLNTTRPNDLVIQKLVIHDNVFALNYNLRFLFWRKLV